MNLALAFDQIGSAEKALPLFPSLEADARLQKRELPSYALAAYARALAAGASIPQAVLKMKAAVASDSQNAELHDELGSLYAQQKDWANAQQEFAAAVRLNPHLAIAHLHLGLAMRAQGQQEGLTELANGIATRTSECNDCARIR